jgi:hypothetical protein
LRRQAQLGQQLSHRQRNTSCSWRGVKRWGRPVVDRRDRKAFNPTQGFDAALSHL